MNAFLGLTRSSYGNVIKDEDAKRKVVDQSLSMIFHKAQDSEADTSPGKRKLAVAATVAYARDPYGRTGPDNHDPNNGAFGR